MINEFGIWWLKGPKYDYSRKLAGDYAWNLPIKDALAAHGLNIDSCNDMHDVIRLFLGKYFWKPDAIFQARDIVLPPLELLARGGDDCDGWAMCHGQALEYVLKPKGWTVYNVSYFANPWWNSHHFNIMCEPNGQWWAVQPQPTQKQWDERNIRQVQVIFGPFRDFHQAMSAVVAMYQGTSIVWWTYQGTNYRNL